MGCKREIWLVLDRTSITFVAETFGAILTWRQALSPLHHLMVWSDRVLISGCL